MIGFEHYRKREWLSVSALLDFSRCPRRFFYKNCGLSKEFEHPALSFGTAIHKAFPLVITQGLEAGVAAFDSVWDKSLEDPKNRAYKSRNRLRAILMLTEVYRTHCVSPSIYELLPPPSSSINLDDNVSDYEVAFAVDIGLPIPLVGRIDSMVRHKDTGELWALELKTASEVSSRYLEGFEGSPQVLAYTLAIKTMEASARGTFIEALLVSATRTLVQIQPVYVHDHQLESFVKWAQYVGGMILKMEEQENFPTDFSGCYPYPQFGMPGYFCDYKNLCHLGEDWTNYKDLFVVRDHRPFNIATGLTPLTVENKE